MPPETTTSPEVPFQAKSVVASLTVKVMVAVWPVDKMLWLVVMAMVGGVVSAAAASVILKSSLADKPPASVRMART